MTCEMTADAMFGPGQKAPRGTYLCLESGLVHRLARPARLPEGGPYRMIAPAVVLEVDSAPVLASRWPEEESAPHPEEAEPTSWLQVLALAHVSKAGSWW